MVMAMMLPLMASSARYIYTMVPRYIRLRTLMLFLIGYISVWGCFAFFWGWVEKYVLSILTVLIPDEALANSILLLVAAILSRFQYRRSAVFSCGGTGLLRIKGMVAYLDAIRYGLKRGKQCLKGCVHIMIPLSLIGHSNLLMLMFTFALFYERDRMPEDSKIIFNLCLVVSMFFMFVFLRSVVV